MLFTLEALDAAHGDSLLLHWGPEDDPRLMLIDGGPHSVWAHTLKPRLDSLQAALVADDGALPIDLVMVSHIDSDHIGGLLGMTRRLRTDLDQGRTPGYDVLELWHNAFDRLLDDDGAPQALATAAGKPATASFDAVASALAVSRPAQAVVASVGQGGQLQEDARKLAWAVNSGFSGALVQAPAGPPAPKSMGKGLVLTVVSPSAGRLDALRAEWERVRERQRANDASWSALAADFVDRSVFNLSSIVIVAEAAGRSMLLTGDARGDDILAGLRTAGFLEGGAAHFDLLKVPHHGSDRNVSTVFFRAVTADHYVISADGKHGNPDVPMLAMLTEARRGDRYAIHLTNDVSWATEFLANTPGDHQVVLRPEAKPSLAVHLADRLPQALEA